MFWGVIGRSGRYAEAASTYELGDERPTWSCDSSETAVWTGGSQADDFTAVSSPNVRENRPAVFVWGHPRIASDTQFGRETRISNISRREIAGEICRLFEAHGTGAFAYLEGNFSLILTEPQSGVTYLVVDKFGCDDICYRTGNDCFVFASHPAFLAGASLEFDPLTVAFYLAHEGFVPAPFTLFKEIETVGRARFLRIQHDANGVSVERMNYWRPSRSYELKTNSEAIEQLGPLLESAVKVRQTPRSGLLLSAGVDSSLLLNIAAREPARHLIAMTGSVKGYQDGEFEIASARKLADGLRLPHEAVVIEPTDETLPDEWQMLTESWMGGSRLTLPIFHRLAQRARNLLGEGSGIISGQMADTLADNNYTNPSVGYRFRRAFYSPWFHRLLPRIARFIPAEDSRVGKVGAGAVRKVLGTRVAEMARSVMCGVKDRQAFFDGRVFGYAEMPGRSSAYFPSLTENGFESVADWYSLQFVVPRICDLTASTFYSEMLELSLDMVMLHLDTRLVFHAFGLEQTRAELPFLDARVVNYFVSIPNSMRSMFREPKYAIRSELRRRKLRHMSGRWGTRMDASSAKGRSADELLHSGSLGAYLRELIANGDILNRVSGIFDYVDEQYASEQVGRFKEGKAGANAKFISRLAALEIWGRMIQRISHPAFACTSG